jgi:hypothetical protein
VATGNIDGKTDSAADIPVSNAVGNQDLVVAEAIMAGTEVAEAVGGLELK